MAHDSNIAEAAIYVGTYAKYNDGSLFGKWLKLSDYSDITEFYEACALLHKDEQDPEYMFQDYEHIPEELVSECSLSEKFFMVRDALEDLGDSETTPFLIWCNNTGRKLSSEDTDDLIADFKDDYIGEYDSEKDFAYELAQQRNDLSEFAKSYFDYEAYANDLFGDSYWSEDGYVFYNS
ncbi:MAG: antirestriction protein ArdA [Candidatus Pedobacter colombiensis]|uniref:Antirestriction protein ArdA n=1 Tax=Candidatus Pedobacter colombiensis TaxID=3121371 RepID=A0AAJ6B5X2_9SPHI|nr:antirestriction protein ArdA [Pedobacter sp.]WEK17941.1 MAG: antirestriction protein ArdA [Pedobacter sp.]